MRQKKSAGHDQTSRVEGRPDNFSHGSRPLASWQSKHVSIFTFAMIIRIISTLKLFEGSSKYLLAL